MSQGGTGYNQYKAMQIISEKIAVTEQPTKNQIQSRHQNLQQNNYSFQQQQESGQSTTQKEKKIKVKYFDQYIYLIQVVSNEKNINLPEKPRINTPNIEIQNEPNNQQPTEFVQFTKKTSEKQKIKKIDSDNVNELKNEMLDDNKINSLNQSQKQENEIENADQYPEDEEFYEESKNPFFKSLSQINASQIFQSFPLVSIEFNKKSKRLYRVTQSCHICFTSLENQVFSVECGHSFHKTCLTDYIQFKISIGDVKLKCPNELCEKFFFKQKAIRKLLGKDKASLEKYLDFELKRILIDEKISKNFSFCPTPGCNYIFKRDTKQSQMFCEKCSKSYCLKCKSDVHPQYSCQQYQDLKDPLKANKLSEDLINEMNCKICQKCQAWVSKTQGCNHMTCRCGYEFCYKCGRKYRDPQCKCPLFDQH